MSRHLDRFTRDFDFRYLGRKVGPCDITQDGKEISGHLLGEMTEIKGPDRGRFAVLFVNWPDTKEGILEFTRKYGPIIPPENERSKCFRFSLDAWRENQRALRGAWSARKPGVVKGIKQLRYYVFCEPQIPAFTSNDLRGFIWLSFQTSPLHLHRRCAKPKCGKFFVASRPQERYCGKDCQRWAELRDKKKWWDDNRKKKSILAKRGAR